MNRKDLVLYMDLMLHLPDMVQASDGKRKRLVAEKLFREVPAIVRKYKLKEFDTERFVADLQGFVRSLGWLQEDSGATG